MMFARRPIYLLVVGSTLSRAGRRAMASSASTRYSVQLVAPAAVGVPAEEASASTTTCSYEVFPAGAPFGGLQVCVWVDSYTRGREAQPARSGPFCFDGSRQQLPIDGLELGSHRLSAAVVKPSDQGPSTQLSEVATAHVDVVLQQEFVPTYEWQQVYPWQSVPPGLEVQLPLDGVGQKRARVPPSWRLQLYIPEEQEGGGGEEGGKNGGFFVRTDLRADSTVLELRREIARQPRFGLPLESVTLSLRGRVLGDEETAEGLDLFNRQRDLTPLVDQSRSSRQKVV